jgi:hypothetical protein
MNKPLDTNTSRRRFLTGVGGVVGAATATVSPAVVQAANEFAAAASASVVLHDPRIALPQDLAARLAANGARIIALTDDPVRMWRTEVGALLRRPDTRLFGVTRWADYLIVRGLAAESRRYTRHEQHHAETEHFTWLIA